MGKQKRVSDLIYDEQIEAWNNASGDRGVNVLIQAGTDCGKSYFIKNHLYDYAKLHGQTILFLIHRRDCLEEFMAEIETDGKREVVKLATYQKAGSKGGIALDDDEIIFFSDATNLNRFDYIVCDEAQYFTGDATFNAGSYQDLMKILSTKHAIKVFMSGTPEIFRAYCKKQKIEFFKQYQIDGGSNKIIRTLNFFYEDDIIQETIDMCLKEDKKCIFFFDSLETCHEYYLKYRDKSLFNCSKYQKKYFDDIDQELLRKLYTEHKFDCQFLFTTIAMDSGLNIIDPDLHDVLVHVYDVDVLRQCIGRKRRTSDNDYVDVRIRAYGAKGISNKIQTHRQAIKVADDFIKYGKYNYIGFHKGVADSSGIILDIIKNGDIDKKINPLKEFKCRVELKLAEKMTDEKNGYCKHVARKLGKTNKWSILKPDGITEDCNARAKRLEELVGTVWLSQSDRKEIIDVVNVISGGKQRKTRNVLNSALEEEHLPYYIDEFETSRTIDGKKKNFKSAWKLTKKVS